MRIPYMLCLISVLITSITFSQVRETKLPIDAGVGCANVTRKLDSEVKDGQMLVSQCCGGLRLIADVKEDTVDGKKRKHVLRWHILNAEGKELEAEMGKVIRESMKGVGKERVTFRFEETLIIVREPRACFIVGRKDLQ